MHVATKSFDPPSLSLKVDLQSFRNIPTFKKGGKDGGIIFKIDLEKAYDRISWSFLEKCLDSFKFDKNWIKLVMSCVTQGETSILWNGEPLQPLSNERGLREGDPFSPYLFVLCLEYLSNFINEVVDSKR